MSDRHRKLPSVFYNGITLAGAALAGVSLALILMLMVLEWFSHQHSPYMGIVAFVVLPVFLVLGLLAIAFGAWRQQRRRRLGLSSTDRLPRIDLNQPAHLRAAAIIGAGTVIFLLLTAFGSFKAYEYTDSDQFCGTVCHEVMKPEYTAYQESPHARVGCVQCHIGPGAQWFVKSKLSGAYQLYSVAFDKFSRPIETPVRSLRPSRDTCEQCHWPAHFSGDKMITHNYYSTEVDDEINRLHLLMRIGGGGAGVAPPHGSHWHVSEHVEVTYVAVDDEREVIPWVKLKLDDGTEKVFRSPDTDPGAEQRATHETRLMDCIDCHNRPSHHYNPPNRLVNRALSNGLIPDDLPDIKNLLVEQLAGEYETEDEALAAIAENIEAYYAEDHPEVLTERPGDIATAVVTTQFLFRTNIFPEMNTSWREFPDHIGHLHTDGCFRCHDGLHATADGEVISRDCNLCHEIVAQELVSGDETTALGGGEFQHPVDIDEEWKETACVECHGV